MFSVGAQNMKRRGLALNINVSALLPGSKPLKTPNSAVESPTTPSSEPIVVAAVSTPPTEEVQETVEAPVPEAVPEATTTDAASFDEVRPIASQLSHLGKVNISRVAG